MNGSRIIRRCLLLCTLVFLTGFSSFPPAKTGGTRFIDGRRVAFSSAGEGSPTIVLESGYGETMSTWAPVFEELGGLSSVFAYDRPGYGRSRQRQDPSTARDVAVQLHQNLVSTGHCPPYLLVGHSLGGLYVNMFARLYPDEVAGVLLLDPSHPVQMEYLRTEEPDRYAQILDMLFNGGTPYEGLIMQNMHGEFAIASPGPFPDVPLIVLTSGATDPNGPWRGFHEELAHMSAMGTHKIVADSGHYIHVDKPQIVLDEVEAILDTGA